MLPLLFACTGETPSESKSEQESQSEQESESSKETEEYVMQNVDQSMRDAENDLLLLGRAYYDGSSLVCDNVGDGIAFRLRFQGELILTATSDRDSYYTVYMDGERLSERICFADGESYATVAENDDDEIHEIRIVAQNEAQFSLSSLDSIEFYGTFEEAPVAREYYIEFIGDSLMTGYGNLVPSGTPDVERSLYQDGTQAFPFMTAEALGGDCAVVGCSGIGVTSGWRDFNMDVFFPARSYYRDPDTEYTYTRVPDLVVLSLGTNDVYAPSNAVNMNNSADVQRLTDGFKALVAQIGEYYDTDIPVILLYGMGSPHLDSFAPLLMEELGGESAGMYALKLNPDGSGGNGHPSLAGHDAATETLTEYIREKGLVD